MGVVAAAWAAGLSGGGAARASNTPSEILGAYGIGTVQTTDKLTGAGQTIAIYTDIYYTGLQTDLNNFSNAYVGKTSTTLAVTDASGNALTSNTSTGSSAELAIDVEYSHLIAPGATIHVVYSSSENSAAYYAANTLKAAVFSSSYGSHNTDETSAYETETSLTNSNSFKAINALGKTTVLSAAGDTGVLDYPASSPYAVAVGGTELTTTTAGKYVSEAGWANGDDGNTSGGGGGGADTKFAMPEYQLNSIGTAKYGNYRVGPDVSIAGGPESALPIFCNSSSGAITPTSYNYGSSIATPMWAGLIADADQDRVVNGLATLSTTQTLDALYGTYTTALYAQMFHDITGTATNSAGAETGTGYDDLTGLGSPIANELVPYLGTYATPEPSSLVTLGGALVAVAGSSGRRRRTRHVTA